MKFWREFIFLEEWSIVNYINQDKTVAIQNFAE